MLQLVYNADLQPKNPIVMADNFAQAAYHLYQRNTPDTTDTFETAQKEILTLGEDAKRLSEIYTIRAICGHLCPELENEAFALETNLAPVTQEIV